VVVNESRLVKAFLELVAIDSPSGHEEAISLDLAGRLAALGGEATRDEHGNVIARWAGDGDWLMLSAHMDTVGVDVGIKPQIRDGVIYSDGTTILGGDDKSGVVVILEALAVLRERDLPRPPLEVVFSVSEETQLRGARLLDKGQLRARRGYVMDAGGPIGIIVASAPSQDSLQVTVHGKKAHAGSEPENGINAIRVASEAIAAMPLGRIDAETTANIGVIEGGTATNIVPDEVKIRGEARSRDDFKLASQTAAMAQAFEDAAERHGARVELKIKRMYNTYALPPESPVVAAAVAAAERLHLTPRIIASGGGTDANIYAEHGIHCAVLSTGQAEVHTPKEHIAIADMVSSARWLLETITGGGR
jgi:tripeptide aminopeptidase